MIKFFFVVIFFALKANAFDLTGEVVAIADGDTLTVLDEENNTHKIRLYGIDAPEKGQAFSQKSKEGLSNLCFRKIAELDIISTDRYGRSVAYVYCDAINVNYKQVYDGLAWIYTEYNKDNNFIEYENSAKANRRGLWADPNPVYPSKWRKEKR